MLSRRMMVGLVLSMTSVVGCSGDKEGSTTESGTVETDTDTYVPTDTDTDTTDTDTDTDEPPIETGPTDTGPTQWTYYTPTGGTGQTTMTGDTGGGTIVIPPAIDSDGDGFGEDVDCDDTDPLRNPGADEICDSIDNDCDGFVDDADGSLLPTEGNVRYFDRDGDGEGDILSAFATCGEPFGVISVGGDCDDTDPLVNTTATEVCDGVDNDCDGLSDDEDDSTDPSTFLVYFTDADDDGFGAAAQPVSQCWPAANVVADNTDCVDTNDAVFPTAAELCDGVDNDCDALVDDADQILPAFLPVWYVDADGDGYGSDVGVPVQQCATPANYVTLRGDCNDSVSGISPDALEVCDGIDNDCDDLTDDEDEPDLSSADLFFVDLDNDGYGIADGAEYRCAAAEFWAPVAQDCDDTDDERNPGLIEICDGKDNNCSELIDDADPEMDPDDIFVWFVDADVDGFGDRLQPINVVQCARPSGFGNIAPNDGDCDDTTNLIHPDVVEVCDGLDQNCSGVVDDVEEGQGFVWYLDVDGDGFGGDIELLSCTAPEDAVIDGADCDDNDPSRSPYAEEICNGIDDDCDGLVDALDVVPSASYFVDSDGDGFGGEDSLVVDCDAQPAGTIDIGGDCDDSDSIYFPGATEVSGDGRDYDCDGHDSLLGVTNLLPNYIRISEVMVEPSRVADEDGEWFELFNSRPFPANLNGLEVHSGSQMFVIGDFLLLPGEAIVVGPTDDFVASGGAPADLIWENFSLDETSVLTIENAGTVLSTFDPNQGGIEPGLAWQYGSSMWCPSPVPYGFGDWGSPGLINPDC